MDNKKRKPEQLSELLSIYTLEVQYEESWLGKFIRFQNLEWCKEFQKKHTVKGIFSLRFDDLIYLILLLAVNILFSVYSHVQLYDQYPYFQLLVEAFKQYNIMMFVGSAVWILFPHWYTKLAIAVLYILMPISVLLIFTNILTFDPIAVTATALFECLGYLTLPLNFLILLIVYPLKEYIRNNIGSLLSFFYAFSVLVLIFLWPVYQLLAEVCANNLQITLTFVSSNIGVFYAIWCIILVFIYLYIHRSICSPNKQQVKNILLQYLNEDDLLVDRPQDSSFLVRHYRCFSRTVSFLIFVTLVGSQSYFLYLLIGYVQQFNVYKIGLMASMATYSVLFLILGSFILNSKLSNSLLFVILSISGVLPSASYPFVSTQLTGSLSIVVLLIGPFTAVFWMMLRTPYRFERVRMLTILFYLYLFYYIPTVLLALNKLQLLTTDTTIQATIQLVIILVIGGATGVVVMAYTVIAIINIYRFIVQSQKKVYVDRTIDFDFEQDPVKYVPYEVSKEFSLKGLSEVSLIRSTLLINSILFVGSAVVSLYALDFVLQQPSGYFYSSNISNILISQLPMVFLFYLSLQLNLSTSPDSQTLPTYLIVLLVVELVGGSALIGVSFILPTTQTETIARLIGITLLVILAVSVGFGILKNRNAQIHKFITPVATMLLWFLLLIPFALGIPIVSAFVDQSSFGNFMYYVILGTSALVIVVVMVITLVFNALMNRFEEEKRVKFITNQLRNYFADEGVQSDDNSLHRLYESYEYRDKKYVFYLNHGYPVGLWEAEGDNKLVTMEQREQLVKKDKQIKHKQKIEDNKKEEQKVDSNQTGCLMSCLNCLCGDEQLLDDKIEEVVKDKKISQDGLEDLLPLMVFDSVMDSYNKSKNLMHNKVIVVSNAKKHQTVSSRTTYLRTLTENPRRIVTDAQQQVKFNRKFRFELFAQIFDFFSNNDYPPSRIIYNDLKQLFNHLNVNPDEGLLSRLYDSYAKYEWNTIYALDMEGFALLVGDVADQLVEESEYQTKRQALLIEAILPGLMRYKQFREYMDKLYKLHRFQKRLSDLQESPFYNYDELKRALKQKQRENNLKLEQKRKNEKRKKQPIEVGEQVVEKKQKEITCRQRAKRRLYDCCSATGGCVVNTVTYIPRKIQQLLLSKKQQTQINKRRIKPWDVLIVESVKLIETTQSEYHKKEMTEYRFRHIFNNYFPAIMKLLDLYYFISLSIGDTIIGWIPSSNTDINPNNGGALYQNYQVLFWVCAGLTIVYLLMSIWGVKYISEGRFGLTQTGAPALFPTPMFFFTNIYKTLSLTLFSFIMTTIYDTFDCTWLKPSPFKLYRDSSIECLSSSHTIFVSVAIFSMAVYYPIAAYVGPNFQFAEKSLDLKYKPSYLVLYFQCKLILVAAKVLLVSDEQNFTQELIYIGLILTILLVLGITIWRMEPCLISWFNLVDLTIILVSFIVNVCGLALYLTKQWVACLVAASVGSALVMGGMGWYLKAKYWKSTTQQAQISDNDELIRALQYKQNRLKQQLVRKLQKEDNVSSNQALII